MPAPKLLMSRGQPARVAAREDASILRPYQDAVLPWRQEASAYERPTYGLPVGYRPRPPVSPWNAWTTWFGICLSDGDGRVTVNNCAERALPMAAQDVVGCFCFHIDTGEFGCEYYPNSMALNEGVCTTPLY